METTDITQIKVSVSPIIKESEVYTVTCIEDVEKASAFVTRVYTTIKDIEAKRIAITAPLNKSLSETNAMFKEIVFPLEQAKAKVSNAIMEWKRAENMRIAKEEERRRAIQRAHEAQGHEVAKPVVMEKPKATIANTQTRKVWRFKIVDESKVPSRYRVIDTAIIGQDVRAGIRSIEGVEIFQEEILAIV
jgi:hypothetical protein